MATGGMMLPLKLQQPDIWPFDLVIVDAKGTNVVWERRYASSTADKSPEEALACAHFPRDQREATAAANVAQVAKMELIVRAVNSHDALLAAVRYADTRAVSRAAYEHACIEDRKLRDLIDAALSAASPTTEESERT